MLRFPGGEVQSLATCSCSLLPSRVFAVAVECTAVAVAVLSARIVAYVTHPAPAEVVFSRQPEYELVVQFRLGEPLFHSSGPGSLAA